MWYIYRECGIWAERLGPLPNKAYKAQIALQMTIALMQNLKTDWTALYG